MTSLCAEKLQLRGFVNIGIQLFLYILTFFWLIQSSRNALNSWQKSDVYIRG